MHRLSPFLMLAVAMTASSCVYQSGATRYSGVSRPVSVWDQSNVAYQTGIYPSAVNPSLGLYRPTQSGQRLYTGVSGIPDTTRLYNQVPAPYGRRENASSGTTSSYAALTGQVDESRRLTGPSASSSRGLSPRSEVSPSQRSALSQLNDSWRRRPATTRSASVADRLASASSTPASTSSTTQDQSDSKPAESEPQRDNNQESRPAPDPTRLPFAQPVPGRSGYVKLSGHPNLPEIDVRGIAPGTPVEVPDPANSGQTIQFRVP